MASRNPPWAREELILALDLYFRLNPAHISSRHEEIVRLSQQLNRLNLHGNRPDPERFRNPNAVYMKLCNFLRFDPTYHGSGLKAGGILEETIWQEFSGDKDALGRAAQAILRTLR